MRLMPQCASNRQNAGEAGGDEWCGQGNSVSLNCVPCSSDRTEFGQLPKSLRGAPKGPYIAVDSHHLAGPRQVDLATEFLQIFNHRCRCQVVEFPVQKIPHDTGALVQDLYKRPDIKVHLLQRFESVAEDIRDSVVEFLERLDEYPGTARGSRRRARGQRLGLLRLPVWLCSRCLLETEWDLG